MLEGPARRAAVNVVSDQGTAQVREVCPHLVAISVGGARFDQGDVTSSFQQLELGASLAGTARAECRRAHAVGSFRIGAERDVDKFRKRAFGRRDES
jgi:hypothetical protein